MDFAEPIAVVVAGILPVTAANGPVQPGNTPIGRTLVAVERRLRIGGGLDLRLYGGLFGVDANFEAKLAAFSPDQAQYRRAVVSKGAPSASLVGPSTRRIRRISVPVAFFPRFSGSPALCVDYVG